PPGHGPAHDHAPVEIGSADVQQSQERPGREDQAPPHPGARREGGLCLAVHGFASPGRGSGLPQSPLILPSLVHYHRCLSTIFRKGLPHFLWHPCGRCTHNENPCPLARRFAMGPPTDPCLPGRSVYRLLLLLAALDTLALGLWAVLRPA